MLSRRAYCLSSDWLASATDPVEAIRTRALDSDAEQDLAFGVPGRAGEGLKPYSRRPFWSRTFQASILTKLKLSGVCVGSTQPMHIASLNVLE